MADTTDYSYMKVLTDDITMGQTQEYIKNGCVAFISTTTISDNVKAFMFKQGVTVYENVNPDDMVAKDAVLK